ncbi:MAG: translation elongation factor G, partial [Lachnospirales bacterium]
INKIDNPNYDRIACIEDIKNKLTSDIAFVENNVLEISEALAERDEEFLDKFFENNFNESDVINSAVNLIKDRNLFVIMEGSALKDIGIDKFFEVFDKLTKTDFKGDIFKGKVFKIKYDDKGNRVTFIKALSGSIKVKENIEVLDTIEKINEIRFYSGLKYSSENTLNAGEICAVTGLKSLKIGDTIINNTSEIKNHSFYFNSALQSQVVILDNTDKFDVLKAFKILENEEPLLSVDFVNENILINIMGKIQLEVLKVLILDRFNIEVDFEKPNVSLRETITNTVMGIGHYEPLRHYAEVQLLLEPNKRGEGITFESRCHIDTLSANYQALVKTHIFEKIHKGILTGSPITDINIVLNSGKAHLKHTEGGDFREATYRAIRQGLEKAENILLEAYYSFDIYISDDYIGRVMTDIKKLRGTFLEPSLKGNIYHIKGRGPVREFMDYPMELLSFTKGSGSMSVVFDGYDICEISDSIIAEIGYDKGADKENTSCSVFCKKGAGYTVNWDEVDSLAHTLK